MFSSSSDFLQDIQTTILEPPSLLEQCITTLLTHQTGWIMKSERTDTSDVCEPVSCLAPNLSLPESVCNTLLRLILPKNAALIDVFRDTKHTRVTEIDVRKAQISFSRFEILMRHRPEQVWLGESDFLPSEIPEPSEIADVVLENLDNCFVLSLGNYFSGVLNDNNEHLKKARNVLYLSGRLKQETDSWLKSMQCFRSLQVFELVDSKLDISQLEELAGILGNQLRGLSLRGSRSLTRDSERLISTLCLFTRLETLDIAMPIVRPNSSCVLFSNPEESLINLLNQLPLLRCLDISCTNLDKAIVSSGWNSELTFLPCHDNRTYMHLI